MEEKKTIKKKTGAVKKPAAKKTTTKTSPAKKTTSTKTVAKKPAAKKPAAKKTVAKKDSTPVVEKEIVAETIKEETVGKKVERVFNIYYFQGIIYSIIAFVIGVFLISKPDLATRIAELSTAILFIIIGLAGAFSNSLKEKIKLFNYNLVFGILAVIIGILIILNPFALSDFLTISFGVFLILNGLVKVEGALKLKSVNENSWSLLLTIGIINGVFGIIIIFNPFVNLYFTQVVGMFLILYAIMEFTQMILLKQRSKSFLKVLK